MLWSVVGRGILRYWQVFIVVGWYVGVFWIVARGFHVLLTHCYLREFCRITSHIEDFVKASSIYVWNGSEYVSITLFYLLLINNNNICSLCANNYVGIRILEYLDISCRIRFMEYKGVG